MSRTARRLLLIAAIAASLLVALIIALPSIVSLDAVRARVLAAAESSLHRKVESGSIRLQIFSGLGAGLDKVAVRNGPGWQSKDLLSADSVSVKIAFWPLLSRRLEITRVVLDGVSVAVERDAKGAWNIDDFLSARQAGRPAETKPREAAAALLVSRLEVARGRILFLDRKVAPGKTVTVALEDLTGVIENVGPAPRFDLSARFLADSGRNLTVKGTLGPAGSGDAPIDASFAGKLLALGRLAPYLGSDLGLLSADGTLKGAAPGGLKLAVNIALAPPAPPSAIPPVEGKLEISLDRGAGTLVIAKSPLTVAKLPLTAEGRIDGLNAAPRIDLRLETPGNVSIDSVTGLPGLSGRLPANMTFAGRVRLAAVLQGPSADLTTRASMDAAPFTMSVGAETIFSAPSVRATLAARGKGPLSGRVTAPSGKLQKLSFEDLFADWIFANGVVRLTPAANVFGGRLAGRVDADLARPASEARVALDIRNVKAQPLVDSVTTLRNVVAGNLTGKISLASRGLAWNAFTKTGHGEGRISLTEADLRTIELMPAVTRSLRAVAQVAGFQVPAALDSMRFQTLETTLRLAAGRLETPNLKLTGRDLTVTASGSIGLDRSLSYEGRVILGPSIVKSFGNAGRFLADEQGRLTLPLRVSGQISAPKVVIDETVILDLGRRVLARQARERIQGPAGKLLGDALEGGSSGADPLGILQQLLKPPSPPPTPLPR